MKNKLGLFEGYGVELEYMIVNRDSFKVAPVCDEVIKKISGEYRSEVELGVISVSNELVLHVIELKTNGPAGTLAGLENKFHEQVKYINGLLEEFGAFLVPSGAHPFMDPLTEARLWPHEYNEVYEAYSRIFGCKGHGWSNLQSLHLNLPFNGDEEFRKLHSAIRMLLPVIPALTASTPVIGGTLTGYTDTRLEYYRKNQAKVPEIAGYVIPEVVKNRKEYEEKILGKIYTAITPYDTDNILRNEWLNSRGAITRFGRGSIEIRIIDIQESPLADISLLYFIVEILKLLVKGEWMPVEVQESFGEKELADIFLDVIKYGSATGITDSRYLAAFGSEEKQLTVREFWKYIYGKVEDAIPDIYTETVSIIIEKGNLSERITASLGDNFAEENIEQVYRGLAEALSENRLFTV